MNKIRRQQRGQTILETGLCLTFLVPLFAGSFTIGMSLVKSIQVSSVCRNANVLSVRNVNMALAANQKVLARTAKGLGLTDASDNILASGKGVIVLSRVTRLGATECSQATDTGLPTGTPLTPATCPNYGYYVFTNRIVIGNSGMFTGTIGSPVSPTDTNGDISPNNYAKLPGNRASGFPSNTYMFTATAGAPLPSIGNAILYLDRGSFVYVAEALFDVSDVGLLPWTPPMIYARNFS